MCIVLHRCVHIFEIEIIIFIMSLFRGRVGIFHYDKRYAWNSWINNHTDGIILYIVLNARQDNILPKEKFNTETINGSWRLSKRSSFDDPINACELNTRIMICSIMWGIISFNHLSSLSGKTAFWIQDQIYTFIIYHVYGMYNQKRLKL